MPAYVIRRADGAFADAIIRAGTEERARTFMRAGETIHLIPDSVAKGLRVPETEGRHEGVLSRWVAKPSNLFGESFS
jgi:hypothetical protein